MAGLGEDERRRIERLQQLSAAVREQVGRLPVPFFGHMRLDTGLRETDVLLGASSHVGHGFALIDWHTAPLAEVFFTVDEGDSYEIEVGERQVTGRLIEKNLVTFRGGELVRVRTPAATLRREGEWRRTHERPPALLPRPPAARRPFRSPLEVDLDAAQQRVVDLPREQSVLLLGEAGFGKTTVALHRLVALRARAGRRFEAAVVVPTEGLRRLTRMMLERRGAGDLEVFTYERLAARLGRIFRDLPRRLSVNTPTRVSRLKRHPALRPVLEAFVRAHPRPIREAGAIRNRAQASRADLFHLFGDRQWMAKVVDASNGALPFPTVAEVAEHTRIQFLDPTEVEQAHVDAEQLVTVDGASIDEGTPLEDARSFDFEDVAVLFELDRLRAIAAGEAPTRLGNYHCVLVDEAQEFAPLELSLMGRGLREGGTVIVAGDAAQQVDPTAHFAGWEDVMQELGAPTADRTVLQVNYRCPADVTALARGVIDPQRKAPEREPSITRVSVDTPFELAVWLTEAVRELMPLDPQASVAVIARSSEAARTWSRWLRHGLPMHLALEGDFPFRAGPLITSVPEVKGLEFDHVIVPDASLSTYPETAEARRALYVAVTRATHRLTLAATGPFSPVLPALP